MASHHQVRFDLDEFPRINYLAVRSFRAAGYRDLRHLAGVPRAELARLQNVGPRSLEAIQVALGNHGLSLG